MHKMTSDSFLHSARTAHMRHTIFVRIFRSGLLWDECGECGKIITQPVESN